MATSLVRHLFNEAGSGTAPAALIDDSGNGNDLLINYGGGAAVWGEDAVGRYLEFTAAAGTDNSAIAILSDIVANGNLGADLNGLTQFAIVIKADIDAGSNLGSRIFQVGETSGNGQLAFVEEEFEAELRINGANGARLQKIEFGDEHVFIINVDTTQPLQANRVRLSIDNVNENPISVSVGQGEALSTANASYNYSIGNRGSQNRNPTGKFRYFEIFAGNLTSQEEATINAGLAVNDNVNPLINQPPVAADQSFDITVGASAGSVIGALQATDNDGTIDTWSITGANVAVNSSSGQLTLVNAGLSAGTSFVEQFTVTDDSGDSVTRNVTFNVVAPVFGIDAVSSGPYYVGDTITLDLSNANASGKVLSVGGENVTLTAETSAQVSFQVFDPKTFGANPSISYGEDITFTLTDGASSDTFTIPITARDTASIKLRAITEIDGLYSLPEFAGFAVGQNVHAERISGDGTFDPATGVFTSGSAGSSYVLTNQDPTNANRWGLAGTVTINTVGSPATGSSTIDGTAEIGQVLTANTSQIADPDGIANITYAWYRGSTPIPGETASTYTVAAADSGQQIILIVEIEDNLGVRTQFPSTPVLIGAAPPVSLSFDISAANAFVDSSGSPVSSVVPIWELWSGAPEDSGSVLVDSGTDLNLVNGRANIDINGASTGVNYVLVLRSAGAAPTVYGRLVGQLS